VKSEDDWRLATNEAPWMHGARLRRTEYRRPSPDWDHDHCRLCWAKFAEEDVAERLDALPKGYVRDDERICQTCFEDFREHFGWSPADA
jgi:hypothetical protein